MSIPNPDLEFESYRKEYKETVDTNRAALGVSDADIAELDAANSLWESDYPAHVALQSAAEAATEKKQNAKKRLVAIHQKINKGVRANSTVTTDVLVKMRLSPPDQARTRVGTPATRPVLRIDTSVHLQHTIHFADENTPGKKGKPKGIKGCEIWAKIGDPAPVDATQVEHVALDGATPYLLVFKGADVGKTVYYMARWMNTRQEPGSFCQVVSAVVA